MPGTTELVFTKWLLLLLLIMCCEGQNLVKNGGFESGLTHWECRDFNCTLTADSHSGHNGVEVTGRNYFYDGPSQYIDIQPGRTYNISGWIKLLNDGHAANAVQLEIDYLLYDYTHEWQLGAHHAEARVSDGWIHLTGRISAPRKALRTTRIYYQSGPDVSVDFVVDDVSVADDDVIKGENLLQNAGFESGMSHWECHGFRCTPTTESHTGDHAVEVSERRFEYEGPSQYINVTSGHTYLVHGWIKLLNEGNGSNNVQLEIDHLLSDHSHEWQLAALRTDARVQEGWIYLSGGFTAPRKDLLKTRIYYQSGPDVSVNYIVDDVSVIDDDIIVGYNVTSEYFEHVIDRERKSDIHIRITTSDTMNKEHVQIHVLQTKKSFPFGTAISTWKYSDNVADGKYRDFIHQHFNWAVPGAALKWHLIEPYRGQKHYHPTLEVIQSLRSHGMKVRGHNLVWSVPQYVQDWVKVLSGDELRSAVKEHIQETMNVTRGLLEHWDVNNENLHGTWYQDRLNDPDYNLEIFRIAHNADRSVKLFLNDYGVVAQGALTEEYLSQAQLFKASRVGLYGIGVQCHFWDEQEPNIKAIHVRELDVGAVDENIRADYYEKALRALYGHPAVEGILFWGFWDQEHWRGEKAALARGDNVELTAAGRRVLDLLENQWMTDQTYVLSQSGDQFTARGFHGDYEVRVMYRGQELTHLLTTFALDKNGYTITLEVHE